MYELSPDCNDFRIPEKSEQQDIAKRITMILVLRNPREKVSCTIQFEER